MNPIDIEDDIRALELTGVKFHGNPASAQGSGSVSREFKPYPKFHQGCEEWVLVMERPEGTHVDVRRANGKVHHAAIDLLREGPFCTH